MLSIQMMNIRGTIMIETAIFVVNSYLPDNVTFVVIFAIIVTIRAAQSTEWITILE